MSQLVTIPHFLLVLLGAFVVGVRAYWSTMPAQEVGDADQRQFVRLVSIVSFALFVLGLIVIALLHLELFRATKAVGW